MVKNRANCSKMYMLVERIIATIMLAAVSFLFIALNLQGERLHVKIR